MHTVTRQHQWPDGNFVVEISGGGIDYCNPDALCRKYPGEFEQFADPRDAVEAAIAIATAWKRDCPSRDISIGMGSTGGWTMPFDGEPLTERTFASLRDHAQSLYDELDKCDQCGDLLGKDRYGSHDHGEYNCCSEYCAEKYYEQDEELLAEMESE